MTGLQAPATRRATPPTPHPFRLPRLRRRMLVALVVIAVVGMVAFNVGRQAIIGLSVGDQADTLAAEVAAAEAENAALQRQVDYLQSDAYVTAEARRLRNLGYPGEQILIIPPSLVVSAPAAESATSVDDRPMLERWIELFLGR